MKMINYQSIVTKCMNIMACWYLLFMMSSIVSAERPLQANNNNGNYISSFTHHHHKELHEHNGLMTKLYHFLWGDSTYQHLWPEMEFGWRIVMGTFVGFLGAALGSVGGVGGGGLFVPMLALIIGFDPKSSTAISKCMIMGASGSSVFYCLRLRHPTLDMPIIDYDLAVLLQPMLMLGISIGVTLSVVFADWMLTVLLIILFLISSLKALLKGIDTWKEESVLLKQETVGLLVSDTKGKEECGEDYKPLASGSASTKHDVAGSMLENIYWKELSLLGFVWIGFLVIQIVKQHTARCSMLFWVLDLLQVPIALSVTLYEAVSLYKGKKVIASMGTQVTNWKARQLAIYCFLGIFAGTIAGLLGIGGGFVLGPLFLELGIPPQVASATSTFAMAFSSSMSAVEYYLLKRFPVPYAAYFVLVATFSALVGQHVVRKVIAVFGRASLIIFILAFTIFISAITLGGVGVSRIIEKLDHHEYMGFENFC